MSNREIGASKFPLVKLKRLGLGGLEGEKYLAELAFYYPLHRSEQTFSFFFKDVTYKSHSGFTEAFSILRSHGFPVPDIVRLYHAKDGRTFLLMTEMTQSGKYLLWGYSNRMSRAQKKDLRAMNLDENDLNWVEATSALYAEMATGSGVVLPYYSYHLRQDRNSGSLDFVFLDINLHDLFSTLRSDDDLSSINATECRHFLSVLRAFK